MRLKGLDVNTFTQCINVTRYKVIGIKKKWHFGGQAANAGTICGMNSIFSTVITDKTFSKG